RAADAGHGESHYLLGEIYRHGHGRKWDLGKANQFYQRAADLGSVRGAFQIAYHTQMGIGANADDANARVLYERVLALNPAHDAALNNLAVLHEQSLRQALAGGAAFDAPEVVKLRDAMLSLYERAEEAGSGMASRNLGLLHSD